MIGVGTVRGAATDSDGDDASDNNYCADDVCDNDDNGDDPTKGPCS